MVFSEEDLSSPPFSQAHLFEGASAEVKKTLVTQLNEIDEKLPGGGLKGYLERARSLLADAKIGRNPFEGLKPKVADGIKLTGETGPGSDRYAEFERLGMQELSKTCFCLVAGGLGERLGYPGIKIGITAEVTTGATFMEIYCQHILAFQDYARKQTKDATLELPLAIMTSGDTHEMTLELLKANDDFGLSAEQITVMMQEKVPALIDVDARIAAKDGIVSTKPHGHGDVHALLHQNGLPTKWVEEGRRWLLLFQDTNPLPFRSVCAVLGVSVAENFALNSVTVPRFPGEAIGGIATLEKEGSDESLTVNVEYNQLDPLLKTTPVGGDVADESGFSPYPGNINILVFGLGTMADRLAATGGIVPEFCNPKWADSERSAFKSSTRLECMMQDYPRLCGPGDKVGFTMLERLLCFTCVKNALEDAAKKIPPDCALSAEADIYACNARLLSLAGDDVEIEGAEDVTFLGVTAKFGPRIMLKPSFGVSLEDMKRKVKGKWRISRRSVLVLDGDVAVDSLELDGALTIEGCGSTSDVVVKNDGRELVAIPEADLAREPPSMRIRGYMLTDGDVEVMSLNPRKSTRTSIKSRVSIQIQGHLFESS